MKDRITRLRSILKYFEKNPCNLFRTARIFYPQVTSRVIRRVMGGENEYEYADLDKMEALIKILKKHEKKKSKTTRKEKRDTPTLDTTFIDETFFVGQKKKAGAGKNDRASTKAKGGKIPRGNGEED